MITVWDSFIHSNKAQWKALPYSNYNSYVLQEHFCLSRETSEDIRKHKIRKDNGEKVGVASVRKKMIKFYWRLLDQVRNIPIEAPVRRAGNMKTNRKPSK